MRIKADSSVNAEDVDGLGFALFATKPNLFSGSDIDI